MGEKRFRSSSGRYQFRLGHIATRFTHPDSGSFIFGLGFELTTTGSDLQYLHKAYKVSFDLVNSATRPFHNARDLIAAQVTKLYKEDREREERDKKPFSGKRHTKVLGLMDECYHLYRFRKVLPDRSATIRLANGVFQTTGISFFRAANPS